MSDCRLAELRALIRATDRSRRTTSWHEGFYLVPQGAWDELVTVAKKGKG